MSTIDWSKASEGYDFHFQGKAADPYGKFYKATSDRFVSEVGSYILYRDLAELFIVNHRPEQATQWAGEGLPPVGTELEAGFACEEFQIWHKGVCVAVGEDPEGREEFCVVKFGNKMAMYTAEGQRMRPIRAPEQIEAEQYERDAEEIAKILSDLDGADNTFIAKTLLDCGYSRKVQP